MTTETPIDTAALDAWLAENVLVWTHVSIDMDAEVKVVGCSPSLPDYSMPVPELSTTYEGMRLVLEAMMERGWYISFQCDDTGWGCNILNGKNGVSSFREADAAPAAVALAAKAALESENG